MKGTLFIDGIEEDVGVDEDLVLRSFDHVKDLSNVGNIDGQPEASCALAEFHWWSLDHDTPPDEFVDRLTETLARLAAKGFYSLGRVVVELNRCPHERILASAC